MLYVAGKRRPPRKFARFVLCRPTKKRSFNLLCVLDRFFRTLADNSVSVFLFFCFFLNWMNRENRSQKGRYPGSEQNMRAIF